MTATLRIRRWYALFGALMAPLFLAWGIANFFVMKPEGTEDHEARLLLPRLLGLGVPGLMLGLCLWMMLIAWKEVLTIDGDQLSWRGMARAKRFELSRVTSARWIGFGVSGAVVLREGRKRLRLSFAQYEDEQGRLLIEALRGAIPASAQRGWNLFAYRMASIEARRLQTKPGPDEVLVTRRAWDRHLPWLLPAAGAVGLVAWRFTGEARHLLATLVAPLLGWGVFRLMWPREGRIEKRITLSGMPWDRRLGTFLAIWIPIGLAGMVVLMLLGSSDERMPTVIVGMGVWFAVFLLETGLFESRRLRSEREAADRAAGKAAMTNEDTV